MGKVFMYTQGGRGQGQTGGDTGVYRDFHLKTLPHVSFSVPAQHNTVLCNINSQHAEPHWCFFESSECYGSSDRELLKLPMIHNDSAVTHQSLVVFFGLNIIKKLHFFGLFHYFFYSERISALQRPRLPGLFQGQVSRKATRGCRRLKWQS